jgi:hypothetical protein
MILYNVTCSMDASLEEEWLQWMLDIHIPEVMQSGCFVDFKVMKLLTHVHDDSGVNFAIQYRAKTMDNYENYRDQFAPAMQKKTMDKYGDRVMAFRTLLEEIAGD